MKRTELDKLLSVLENPIRRQILAKLSKERHYPLQLSKELNVSQQAIMKHLKVLEDNDLVMIIEEKSTVGGPPRKSYFTTKRYSIRIDMGPSMFSTDIQSFDEPEVEPKTFQEIKSKYEKVCTEEELNKRFSDLKKLVREINTKLRDLEKQRTDLLKLRESILKETHDTIRDLCMDYDERKILYSVIDHNLRTLEAISERLNLRERVVQDIVQQLAKQRILIELEEDED
jgi:predicted transcriptional regulator